MTMNRLMSSFVTRASLGSRTVTVIGKSGPPKFLTVYNARSGLLPVQAVRATGLYMYMYTLAGPSLHGTRLRQTADREEIRGVGGGLQDGEGVSGDNGGGDGSGVVGCVPHPLGVEERPTSHSVC